MLEDIIHQGEQMRLGVCQRQAQERPECRPKITWAKDRKSLCSELEERERVKKLEMLMLPGCLLKNNNNNKNKTYVGS